MNTERSNLHMTSNVYPVNAPEGEVDFYSNSDFIKQIADPAILKILINERYGGANDYRLLERYARALHGIQEWQIRRLKGCDTCSDADTGDRPWGFRIRRDGTYEEICRCQRKECMRYVECRPDLEKTNAIQ
jgi:hypothetical protein